MASETMTCNCPIVARYNHETGDYEMQEHTRECDTRPASVYAGLVERVEELPMTAFADRLPVRDELNGEQTILIHNASATWDIAFFEAGEPFPERWFGEHWVDISGMWPGVTAQVTEWHNERADQAATALTALTERNRALEAEVERLREASPDDIRAAGWAVAVHNDYRLAGENHTFWLFTRDGRAIKGEGRTDEEALAAARTALGARP